MTTNDRDPANKESLLALKVGEFTSVKRVQPFGSLEARRLAAGVVFYWRYRRDGKADRIVIGPYDSKGSPNALESSAGGYSIPAAERAAESLAMDHSKSLAAGNGGVRADRARLEAKREQEASEREEKKIQESVTVAQAWAVYLEDRRRHWGSRHYADHLSMTKAGGVAAVRGTRGRKVTIAGPLHELMGLRLIDLDDSRVRAWADKHALVRPAVARLALRMLKAFLRWCSEHPEYKAVVVARAASGKAVKQALGKPKAKKDTLLKEQLSAWFKQVQRVGNPVISVYLQVLLLTGCRSIEALAMRWDDLDPRWRRLTIRDKIEGARTIPLTPYVAQLLASLPRRNEWVFSSPTSKSGVITLPRASHVAACKDAGIGHLTIHGLRRSFKSLSEWLELPAGVIAQIMGHKPSATDEKHYTVRTVDLLRVHHERFEAWILDQAGVPRPTTARPALQVVA